MPDWRCPFNPGGFRESAITETLMRLRPQPGAQHLHRCMSPLGRPLIGKEGTQQRNHNGKPSFARTFTLSSRTHADQFSAAIIPAVREKRAEAVR
jgi:hypothetical protein